MTTAELRDRAQRFIAGDRPLSCGTSIQLACELLREMLPYLPTQPMLKLEARDE